MNLKQCSKCKLILIDNQFYRDKRTKDGFRSQCKQCRKIYDKIYLKKNKELRREYKRKYIKKNKVAHRKRAREYTKNNKERTLKYASEYRKHNKVIAYKHRKEYYKKNRKRLIKNSVEYTRERIKNDPKLKTTIYMGATIRYSLKARNTSKNHKHWESLVEFTLEELIVHLENLFQPGMNWENRGEWHIDHKKPISLFNFKSVNDPEFKECWGLNNLQPLWARDNLSKSNKFRRNYASD